MSGFRDQWCQELGCVRGVGHNGISDGLVDIIGAPHGDRLLTGFMVLQQAEAIIIKIKIKL